MKINKEEIRLFGVVEGIANGRVYLNLGCVHFFFPKNIYVGDLVAIRSTKTNEKTICKIVQTDLISKKCTDCHIIPLELLGTFFERDGEKSYTFKRSVENLPEIGSDCFLIEGKTESFFENKLSQYF